MSRKKPVAKTDPQKAHEEDMGKVEAHDPGDASEGSEINEDDDLEAVNHQGTVAADRKTDYKVGSDVKRSDDPDARVKIEIGDVGEKGVSIYGHPLSNGQVIEMHPNDVLNHRDHGIPLIVVPDNDEREVYDVHEPYVNPEHEEA